MMGDLKLEAEICESPAGTLTVTRKLTSTGARITTHINQESERGASPDSETRSKNLAVKADLCKEETAFDPETLKFSLGLSDDEQSIVKAEPFSQVSDVSREIAVDSANKMSFDDFLKATNTKVMSQDECVKIEREARLEKERSEVVENKVDGGMKNEPEECVKTQIDARMESKLDPKPESDLQMVPWEMKEEVGENVVEATPLKCFKPRLTFPGHDPGFEKLGQKPVSLKKAVEDRSLSCVVIENGDFPVDEDWLLVGGSVVNGLSTSKGRKLELNEIVHFNFSTNLSWKNNTQWIVRFSTKRNGEIGRLPMEWAKSVIPLVSSGRIKVFGRSIDVPKNLSMMQEILLYVSFYVHKSVLMVEGDMSSWKLDSPTYIDSTTHPLLSLFQLLSVKPSQGAQFTPEELDSRKRLRNPQGGGAFPQSKRIKGASQLPPPPQSSDEQTISESYLNKLVGAAEMYDLQEMEPPSTLMCDLRPYQKQALFWMTEAEKGLEFDKAPKTLHPCWAEYCVCDQRASTPIYVNIFSGEATTRFPSAMEMSRGGILADAMGLGKTVMTIALILARNGKGIPNDIKNLRRDDIIGGTSPRRAKGGTLIICPMALLSQWKDELETHSTEDSLSIFVHYGGGRTDDPRVMAGYDVVLTTYGTLQSCHKSAGDQSIYHRVDWHRIVLDEAHTIKCSRTQAAQAVFGLSAHCRWCLTGTPLQNNLEDLYSLLCFLHVEPWCNWAWWHKLIQKPYENGDHRGLKLVKAILRPLMLRRTKETKDNLGRPILVLPPTDIKTIECEQSEAEHDFYDALFRKSKVEFDQFVAAGKVLHNYANILELLLRLRQCCNHPFLVMSRGDTQKYSHLNKLAKYFINEDVEGGSSNQLFPCSSSRGAYEEQVAEMGKNTECPICLESPDDPVLTSCAHVMCRECLLASWGSNPQTGQCPLCRQLLSKTELITCPAESRFKLDVEKNWKESSKVSKLLECLEKIRRSGTGEKSIVFSQWTSFLDLLEIPMKRRNIGYLRYDGTLSQKHRERVLKEFNESNKKMVLLMSLRAGGVGLNLTAASNVFLMDPWWNPAVEEQAIMRIHRIGQKRTVLVRRFIVRDTVEERLQQVQAKKERMIAGALTDEEVRSSRLEDLKMLFR